MEIANEESALGGNALECMTTCSKNVSDIDFVRVTLEEDMSYFDISREVWNGRSPTVLKGVDAKEIVERICPDIGRFEVSFVLCFEGFFSGEKAAEFKESFERKHSRHKKWHSIKYDNEHMYFIFGENSVCEKTPISQPSSHCGKSLAMGFLTPNWLRAMIGKKAEGVAHLSAQEVQMTDGLSAEDVQRYVKTYLPRSCAEAFVVLDNHLQDRTIDASVSLLDIGCGSGGSTLGCLLALHKHRGHCGCKVDVSVYDVNSVAVDVAEELFEQAKNHLEGTTLEKIERRQSMSEALSRTYDIVIASKSIGEMELKDGVGTYEKRVSEYSQCLSKDGVFIVIDVPKHSAALERSVEGLKSKGVNGAVDESSISIDGGSDNETFVYACMKHE